MNSISRNIINILVIGITVIIVYAGIDYIRSKGRNAKREKRVKGEVKDSECEALRKYAQEIRNDLLIKYRYIDQPRLEKIEKGDWIDLYCMEVDVNKGEEGILYYYDKNKVEVTFSKGDIVMVNFGISVNLPTGTEAWIAPRSSTFKKTGLILTNSPGVIDNSYNGNEDEWKGMFIATRDGKFNMGDRLAHFRVSPNSKTKDSNLIEVEKLSETNRGSYGTTGN